MTSIIQSSIGEFLDQLASSAPTPGGGSVAALSGAMAAGLVVMVCDLTIGKKQYLEFSQEASNIRAQAEQRRQELQQLADEDITVFNRLSAAYKLPKVTEADAASRRAAIQHATKLASEVPIRTAQAVAALLPLCTTMARYGNRLLASDIGVAALLIRAAVPSALINVEINLNTLEDQLTVQQLRSQARELLIGLNEEVDGILAIVRERMHNN